MIEQKSIQRLAKNTDYVDFDDIRILQTGTLAFDASNIGDMGGTAEWWKCTYSR